MIHIHPDATGVMETMVLYRNLLAEGDLVPSSETPDGYAANALGPQTYDFWVPADGWGGSLSVGFDQPEAADALSIVAHNIGSRGGSVEVQRYDDDSAAWVSVMTVLPADDTDLLLLFPEGEGSWWNIIILGLNLAIGVVTLGKRLAVPYGTKAGYTPINLASVVELAPSITVQGQYVGTYVKRQGAQTSISLAPQARGWIEGEAAPFIEHFNTGRPFIWASCPGLLKSDLGYCWRSGGEMQIVYSAGAQWAEIGMGVQAYVGS